MGLFDFFLSEDKQIQKRQRGVTDRDNQADDREIAARWLAEQGSGKALLALLSRFDMQLEHQLNDQDERELVYALLMQRGQDVIKPLGAHLRKCKKFALPIRLYADLMGEEAAIEMVFDLLRIEREKDDFKPGKKTDMLVWLHERKHPGCLAAAAPFLRDFDEGVRCAAAEVIIAQHDDSGREPLEQALANPEEESNRLRARLIEVFVARRWPVSDIEAVSANLPPTHQIVDGRVVSS